MTRDFFWGDAPFERPEPVKEGPINRLAEPGVGCQLYRGGDSAAECGAPAAPAEVHPPKFRKDEASRTRLRLCPDCFARSAKLRPTAWLDQKPNTAEEARKCAV